MFLELQDTLKTNLISKIKILKINDRPNLSWSFVFAYCRFVFMIKFNYGRFSFNLPRNERKIS